MLSLFKPIKPISPTASLLLLVAIVSPATAQSQERAREFKAPLLWEYGAPLISPEKRVRDRSRAQKDPTVVFHDGSWHVFMTVKLPGRSAIEYCSFKQWKDANASRRTILPVSDSKYYCAPQVFYFSPHKKWYLIYQMGVPNSDKMWVAYSTTDDIADPKSWTAARPILDGGPQDSRKVGGLDYWIICDADRAYLFFTSLNGKLWRMWTKLEDFPRGFGHCEIALQAKIFEASHTYRLKGQDKYLTIVEENGRRYYKAYVADRLDGQWTPLADTAQKPFAGANNVRPAPDVAKWADNISHGELIRDGNDQTLTIDPANLRFIFQGMLDKDKSKKGYGQFQWRIGMLTPVSNSWPLLPGVSGATDIPAQEWPRRPGLRRVRIKVFYPGGKLSNVNAKTGMMLTLHNWGGQDCAGTANPDALANRLNVVAICVNYLQSGRKASIEDPQPYDFGYLQSLDALRALWFVHNGLQQRKIPFDTGRIFCTGGSGGGNVTQMATKLAPRTFACVIDMCGMKKLSDDIAFNLPGGSRLNARWSRDPKSLNYLSADQQEIRFVGHPKHLTLRKKQGTTTKIIIVHGVDDRTCPFKDAEELAKHLRSAQLDVETHFIRKSDLDGRVFTSTGHPLGNRTEIVFRVAGDYLLPDGRRALRRQGKTDFERRDELRFPTTNGQFIISYKNGFPVGRFEREK